MILEFIKCVKGPDHVQVNWKSDLRLVDLQSQPIRGFAIFFVENLYNSLSSAISSHMIRPQVGEFSLRVSSNKEKHSTKVQCLEFRSSDRMYSSLSTSKNHLTCTKSELVVNSVSTLLLFTYF